MGSLHINLRIKFRFLFVDIYTLDKIFDLPFSSVPIALPLDKVLFNDRGVYLRAWNTEPA